MRNDSFEHKGTDKEAELQNHLEEAYLRLMMQKYMEQYGEELLEEEKNLPDSVPKQPTEAQIQQLKDKLAQAAQKSAPPKRRRIAKRLIPVAAVLIALFLATLANAGARSKFLISLIRMVHSLQSIRLKIFLIEVMSLAICLTVLANIFMNTTMILSGHILLIFIMKTNTSCLI